MRHLFTYLVLAAVGCLGLVAGGCASQANSDRPYALQGNDKAPAQPQSADSHVTVEDWAGWPPAE